jgi:transcriptional regulator with XRE-family HTH domain
MTQRTLATLVGVSFAYISKIESGDTPPPSRQAIHYIAQALCADEQELISLAAKVPDELKDMMRDNPLLVELVRHISFYMLPDETYRAMLKVAEEAPL